MDCASHFEACGASCGDMRRAARRLLNRDCSMSAAAMITLSSSMSARCLSGCCPGDRSATGRPKAAVSGGHMLRWPFGIWDVPASAHRSAAFACKDSTVINDQPTVVAVSRDGDHRFSKPQTQEILLLAGLGVHGDAHAGTTVQHRSHVAADPTQPNLRQVHLIHAELFAELDAQGF